MSSLIRYPVQLPSSATLSDFSRRHNDCSTAAIIAVGYSLVLHRFLDVTSYVYERRTVQGSRENAGANCCSKGTQRRCMVLFHPEATILSALNAFEIEDVDKGLSNKQVDVYQAILHQKQEDDGSSDSHHSALSLVMPAESTSCYGSESTRMAELRFNGLTDSEFQAQSLARALGRALDVIARGTTDTASLRLADVDLFSPQDHAIINSWNLDRPTVSQECVPDLVARACAKYPDQVAVLSAYEGVSLTYSRLDWLARRLACHLANSYGIGRGSIVPLCFEKSSLAVVAMLAVLKTGAGYCCLDPQHPRARHDFIRQSVKAPLVLASPTHESLFDKSPVLVVSPALLQRLEQSGQELDREPRLADAHMPEDTSVVVFSSGSTGVPKGIVHTHQTLATGLVQNGPRHGLDRPGIRVFQWCAYTFDISLTEIWGPLICGGAVCIPSEEERLNNVEAPMRRMAVEWAFFTPSFARFFCRQRCRVPTLQTLVVGGEALTLQDAAAFLDATDLARVIHLFGPAELITQFLKPLTRQSRARTVAGTAQEGRARKRAENMPFVPSNAHCWIVDPDDVDRLAPVGTVGELLIEGPALLTGYLNDEARTRAALIEPPRWRFSMDAGPPLFRIYRSGDLVRYTDNGELRYVSRKDGVVKLRGQFVDLGEIESILRATLDEHQSGLVSASCWPAAAFETEVAVLLVTNVPAPGDQALVTFVRPKDTGILFQNRMSLLSAAAPVLQDRLRRNVPEFMVPRLFYAIDKFPYNASGKLDRKALALFAVTLKVDSLFQSDGRVSAEQVAQRDSLNVSAVAKLPRNATQRHNHEEETYQRLSGLLKRAWSDVFGLVAGDIASDADFFQQGGNSMRAMELVAAARHHGVSTSVAKIFANPVLDSLVAVSSMREDAGLQQEGQADVSPFSLLRLESDNRLDDVLEQALAQCKGIDKSDVQDIIPATAAQSEFLAAGLKYPGSMMAQSWMEIPESISLEQFQRAWQHLSDGFAILRSRLVHTDPHGDLQLILDPKRPLEWTIMDSSKQSSRCSHSTSKEEYLANDRARPMGRGDALARYAIIDSSSGPEGKRTMVLTMHQSIYDGVVVMGIQRAINELVNGKRAADVASPSFVPFIKYISSELDETSLRSFWQTYLSGYGASNKRQQQQPFPALPRASSPGGSAPNPDSLFVKNIQIPPTAAAAAAAAAPGKQHITLPTIVLAAWALVIHSYTGDDDIVFPLHISGRGLSVPGIMDMAFPTIALVPVRVRLPSHAPTLIQPAMEATAAAETNPEHRAKWRNFLLALQDSQIQMATTGVGHAGMPAIATYSDACRRAVDVCQKYPLDSIDVQYAGATWLLKPEENQSGRASKKSVNLEFEVNSWDGKYFSPGNALAVNCYLSDKNTALLVFVYDSKVVGREQVAEYATRIEGFIRALSFLVFDQVGSGLRSKL